jgi:hypothetical protein
MTNVFKIVKQPETFTFRAERLMDGKKSLLNDIKNTAEQMVADQRRKNGGDISRLSHEMHSYISTFNKLYFRDLSLS